MKLECLRWVGQKAFLSSQLGYLPEQSVWWKESMGKVTWAAHIQKHHLPFILGLPSRYPTYWSPCVLKGQVKLVEGSWMPCAPAAFLHKAFCKAVSCCVIHQKLSESFFLEDHQLCICITTQLTYLVSGALAGMVPMCRLPVVAPQTSFNRTRHCSIRGEQTTGCSSSLDELLPCDERCTVKWQWFPSSLLCIAGLGSVGSLCLPLGGKMLSLVTEETLPFGVCIHFCLWHTGNEAFIICSEEQIVPLECWRELN